jgi:hypothetical protein
VNWFETHAYVAAWASPTITLIGALIRKPKSGSGEIDWAAMMHYVGFLTCLAAAFTPSFGSTTRSMAASGAFVLLVGIRTYKKQGS